MEAIKSGMWGAVKKVAPTKFATLASAAAAAGDVIPAANPAFKRLQMHGHLDGIASDGSVGTAHICGVICDFVDRQQTHGVPTYPHGIGLRTTWEGA